MSEYDVPCPMPDCGEPLIVTWSQTYGIFPSDITEGAGMGPEVAHSSSWQIGCIDGHVILLPGANMWDCDDPQGDGCPHGEEELDWSDDHRMFRARDMIRLRELLAKMGGRDD